MKHLMQSFAMILVFGWLCAASFGQAQPIVVHEWGTFTSFQDESGNAMHHINTDDEPVPDFVHQIGREFEFRPTEMPPRLTQGAPHAHPSVTIRLETPVLYFHLPEGMKQTTVDVEAQFNGGWLTQFYPRAMATIDAKLIDERQFPEMTLASAGKLAWKGLKVGTSDAKGPETTEKVWLAPRNVNATAVTKDKESEKFLFYRGVGCIDAPLKIVRTAETLQIHPHIGPNLLGLRASTIEKVWLADIRPDGAVAFRTLPAIPIGGIGARPLSMPVSAPPAAFDDVDYAPDNLAKLRSSMHEALVNDGLFADEADALLNTWELSYFQAPGLRLFFLVPDSWTQQVLPLRISGAETTVKRVMVGRIEIVTPRQRELLDKIARAPLPNLGEVTKAMNELRKRDVAAYNALASGRGNPGVLGVEIPPSYRQYLELGRFRTALLLNQRPERKDINPLLSDFGIEVEMPGLKVAQQYRNQRMQQAQ